MVFMKKILYIVIDGLSNDLALMPNLKNLIGKSQSGLVLPVIEGISVDTGREIMGFLGYDAYRYYTGPGPLECYACGLKVNDGDLALRVNFSSLEPDGKKLKDSSIALSISPEETNSLAKEINSKVTLSSGTFELKDTTDDLGALVIRSIRSRLSGCITNTNPVYERRGIFNIRREKFANLLLESAPLAGCGDNSEAKEASVSLNEFTQKSHRVMAGSVFNQKRLLENKPPVNILLSCGAGDHLPKLPAFEAVYNLKFASLLYQQAEKSVTSLMGIEAPGLPSLSGQPDVDCAVLAKVARDSLLKYNGIFIYIRNKDEVDVIDSFFFINILADLDLNNTLIIVAGNPSGKPAPISIFGGGIAKLEALPFERIKIQDIMPLLVKLAQG